MSTGPTKPDLQVKTATCNGENICYCKYSYLVVTAISFQFHVFVLKDL